MTEATPGKARQAKDLAEEFLGRGAAIARASIKPLAIVGRVMLGAGLVIWLVGPAPFWSNAPSLAFSLVALVLLGAPGARLLRHRRRMQKVLDDLPDLIDNMAAALDQTSTAVSGLREQRRATASGRPGLLATGKRCYAFYRHDLGPLRAGPGKVVEQVTDALEAFSGPALVLSAAALGIGLLEVVLCPIAVLLRLVA